MARLTGKKNISKREMLQRFDLKKLLGREPTEKDKREFAKKAIDLIENRTLDGDDVGGIKFTKYSPAYAKKKGVSEDAVDLYDSGDMLSGLARNKNKELKNEVAIEVKGSDEKERGYYHQVGDGQPTRQWFGLTKSQADDVARSINADRTTLNKMQGKGQARQETGGRTTLRSLLDELSQLGIEQVE